MKKYTAVKTLFVDINPGLNRLPDDQTLKGRLIQSIVPCFSMPLLNGAGNSFDYGNGDECYLNLTSDSVNYFFKNVKLTSISKEMEMGAYTRIDQTLSLPDCYIMNASRSSGKLILVVFYEDYSNASSDTYLTNSYEAFEIPITTVNSRRIYLPDNLSLVGAKFSNLLLEITQKSYTLKDVVDESILYGGYLTLCKGTQIIWEHMPLYMLDQTVLYELLDFDNIKFDFQNSYLQLATTDETNVGKVVLLTAKYNK